MHSDHEVERGLPPTDDVLELLNAAYGGWGNEALFEWKASYPDTDPEREFFSVQSDSVVSAFTRLYHRPFTVDGNEVNAVVRGNSAVHPAYQRQGQYKLLHEATADHCDADDIETIMSFNRTDNPSFLTSSKAAWEHTSLPLWLSILSPETALSEYATPFLSSDQTLERLVSVFGPRVRLSVGGSVVSLGSLLDDSPSDRRGVTVYLSQTAFHELVELSTNGAAPSVLTRRAFSLALRNELSLLGSPDCSRPDSNGEDVTFLPRGHHTDADVAEFRDLHALLEQNRPGEVRFRRRLEDVEHMLDHPHLLGTFCLQREEATLGFAPLYAIQVNSVLEARIADLAAVDANARTALLDAIETFCRTIGADVLVALLPEPPESPWVRVRRHVLMWNDRTGSVPDLREKRLRLGFYDVV